jgi:copper chaperone NosL
MKRWLIVMPLMALLFLALAGCGQNPDTSEPPKIVYGQDVCDRCGMIINEEKFAAAYWTKEGEARRFDDVGGMFAFISEKSEEAASYWVHDFVSGEWIRAEEATYVLDSSLKTPMGFGIAAFAGADQARAMAQGQETAEVLTFAEVLDRGITMPAAHGGDMGEMGDMQE